MVGEARWIYAVMELGYTRYPRRSPCFTKVVSRSTVFYTQSRGATHRGKPPGEEADALALLHCAEQVPSPAPRTPQRHNQKEKKIEPSEDQQTHIREGGSGKGAKREPSPPRVDALRGIFLVGRRFGVPRTRRTGGKGRRESVTASSRWLGRSPTRTFPRLQCVHACDVPSMPARAPPLAGHLADREGAILPTLPDQCYHQH